MKTVRITLAMAVALLMAIPVSAQEKEKAAKGKRAKLNPVAQVMLRMSKHYAAMEGIDLTAEQKEKLNKIREELGPKWKEAFGKIQGIFTEEQRAAAEESVKKAREAGKKGRDFFLAVQSSVKLTDEQTEKMNKVAEELKRFHRATTKKVMGVLTPEQKEELKKKMAPQGRKQRKPGEKKDKPAEKKKTE